MAKRLPVAVLALALLLTPPAPDARAQTSQAPYPAPAPVDAGSQTPPWLTIGLIVGGAFLGRMLAQRYFGSWWASFLAARAGAGLGAEVAGLAAVL